MAFLVAIEGIDGAGKGTQAALLQQALQRRGRRAALLSFPRYEHTSFGRRIGEFLNGRFGSLDAVNPFLVSLLYAGDRYESRPVLCAALADNDVVILDRYVPSNIAHQAAKLDGPSRAELQAWIEHVEYGVYGLPKPDLVILLDLSADQARHLIARKRARSYTEHAADLQEADLRYLERVRELYRTLAEGQATWQRVNVSQSGALRSVAEIAAEVQHLVTERLPRES